MICWSRQLHDPIIFIYQTKGIEAHDNINQKIINIPFDMVVPFIPS